jgi:uncharacterized protein DUF892
MFAGIATSRQAQEATHSFVPCILGFAAKLLFGGNMPGQGLKELYIDELKDLYNAENQLIKALPKMAKAASSDELRQGFEEHLEQTKGHVQRLEKIFQTLGDSPKGKTCKGMEGLIKEGSECRLGLLHLWPGRLAGRLLRRCQPQSAEHRLCRIRANFPDREARRWLGSPGRTPCHTCP